jgi:hypothetical protein
VAVSADVRYNGSHWAYGHGLLNVQAALVATASP